MFPEVVRWMWMMSQVLCAHCTHTMFCNTLPLHIILSLCTTMTILLYSRQLGNVLLRVMMNMSQRSPLFNHLSWKLAYTVQPRKSYHNYQFHKTFNILIQLSVRNNEKTFLSLKTKQFNYRISTWNEFSMNRWDSGLRKPKPGTGTRDMIPLANNWYSRTTDLVHVHQSKCMRSPQSLLCGSHIVMSKTSLK